MLPSSVKRSGIAIWALLFYVLEIKSNVINLTHEQMAWSPLSTICVGSSHNWCWFQDFCTKLLLVSGFARRAEYHSLKVDDGTTMEHQLSVEQISKLVSQMYKSPKTSTILNSSIKYTLNSVSHIILNCNMEKETA